MREYEPPESLWKLVEQYVPESDRDEIQSLLGKSLITQSVELHNEIETLINIWNNFKSNDDQYLQPNKLPEPPDVRNLLVEEIKFFVDCIKSKADRFGIDNDKILSRHNSNVLDYILNNNVGGDRSSSQCSIGLPADGFISPDRSTSSCDKMSISSSYCSSSFSDDIESMKDKLSSLKLDEVCNHLQQSMKEEVSQLINDILFLKNNISDEVHCFKAQSYAPSLSELRRERTHLEQELLKSTVNIPAIMNKNYADKKVPLSSKVDKSCWLDKKLNDNRNSEVIFSNKLEHIVIRGGKMMGEKKCQKNIESEALKNIDSLTTKDTAKRSVSSASKFRLRVESNRLLND